MASGVRGRRQGRGGRVSGPAHRVLLRAPRARARVAWAYKSDASLHLPYQDNLSALIHDPTFKAVAGEAVFNKARVINTLGNQAVHSHRPIQPLDALTAVRELFHVSFWLARTYARGAKPR